MEHLSKSPVFPTEIVESIIDHLQDDIVALTRISGTSHAIRHACHRRLFRSVELGNTATPDIVIRLFRYNPSIGQYVRELALHVDDWPLIWIPDSILQNIQVQADIENIQLLTQTPFLEKLSIHGGINRHQWWSNLSVTLQQTIQNRIHSAFLAELYIYGFAIPLTIIQSCSNLSVLTVMNAAIDQASMPPCSPQPINIPQLRSFRIGEFSNSFGLALVHDRDSDGHPYIRFDGLKTLIIDRHLQSETQVFEDICKEAIGLETFACTRTVFHSFATQWPDFSGFSTLKTLRGQCRVYLSQKSLLLGLPEKLQMFPQPNVLETLDVKVVIAAGITARSCYSKSISARNEWGQLDIVLSRGFPRLHTVSINVVWPYSPLANPDSESAEIREAVRVIREKFPWLNGNPAVKFNFSMSLLPRASC